MREFAITDFNRLICKMDKPSEPAPLDDVIYNPIKERGTLAEDVADMMALLPWKEVYGLDYEQVLALPYDEWSEYSVRLEKRLENKSFNTNTEALLSSLNERISQLSADLLTMTKMFLGAKPQNGQEKVPFPVPKPHKQ